MMDLFNKDISQLRKLMETGKFTSEELTKKYLKSIQDKDLKLYNTVSEEYALNKARTIDRKRQEGKKLGVLAGIPLAVTDDISTKDVLTTVGSKILEDYIPPFNATVVENLLKEDAIVLGKIKIDEFNLKSNNNAAKVIREDEALFSLNSYRANGEVFSIKPSYGLVSRYGFISATSSLDQIATSTKSVKDMAIVLNSIIEYDKKDSSSIDLEKRDYTNALTDGIKGMKIALPKNLLEFKDEDSERTFSTVIENLESKGAIVQEISLPKLDYLLPTYNILLSGEFASNAGKYDGIGFGYRTENYEDRGDLYKKTRSEAFSKKTKQVILFGNYVIDSKNYNKYYKKAQKIRTILSMEYKNIIDEYGMILTPVNIEENQTDILQALAHLTGFPAISMPTSTKTRDSSIGLQIIGKYFGEEELLKIAYNHEQFLMDSTVKEVHINE